MTRIPPPSDPIEALGEAYELVLERLLDRFHVRDPHHRPKDGEVEEWLEEAAHEAAPHLDEQQRTQVKTAVARDLHSLGHYRKRGGTDAEGWLGFERHRLVRQANGTDSENRRSDPERMADLEDRSGTTDLSHR